MERCASSRAANSSAASTALLARADEPEPIIDIHQHTDYSGRTDEQLIAHQRKMGVTHTVLLPAGRFFGLEAMCSGNDRVQAVAKMLPREFSFFANEVPYLSDAREVLVGALRAGAIGIGEQKFMVDADSRAVAMVAEVAQEFGVPVLLHFQFGRYNTGFENFPRIVEKFPKVTFIGHAQTWWANIDGSADQKVLYPKGPVTPGGLTDKYLTDYPNVFADMSAGSGLNALLRDEDYARAFIARHRTSPLWQRLHDAIGEGAQRQANPPPSAASRRTKPPSASSFETRSASSRSRSKPRPRRSSVPRPPSPAAAH